MAARGYPLSALFPATAPLYRSLGWELAGGRYEVTRPGPLAAGPGAPRPRGRTGRCSGGCGAGGPGAAGPVSGACGAGSGRCGSGSGRCGVRFRALRVRFRALRDRGPARSGFRARRAGRRGRDHRRASAGLHAAGTGCGPVTFDAPQLATMLQRRRLPLPGPGRRPGTTGGTPPAMRCSCTGRRLVPRRRARRAVVDRVLARDHRQHRQGRGEPRMTPSHGMTSEPDGTMARTQQVRCLRLLDAPRRNRRPGLSRRARACRLPLDCGRPAAAEANSGDWPAGSQRRSGRPSRRARPASADCSCAWARGAWPPLYAGTPRSPRLRLAGLAAGGTADARSPAPRRRLRRPPPLHDRLLLALPAGLGALGLGTSHGPGRPGLSAGRDLAGRDPGWQRKGGRAPAR